MTRFLFCQASNSLGWKKFIYKCKKIKNVLQKSFHRKIVWKNFNIFWRAKSSEKGQRSLSPGPLPSNICPRKKRPAYFFLCRAAGLKFDGYQDTLILLLVPSAPFKSLEVQRGGECKRAPAWQPTTRFIEIPGGKRETRLAHVTVSRRRRCQENQLLCCNAGDCNSDRYAFLLLLFFLLQLPKF